MPSVNLSANAKQQFFLSTGALNVGGKLFTYLAGTSTPTASYTDSTGTTANTNPIILDSRGECNLWLVQSQAYKLTLQDAAGNLIWTVDNVNYSGVSGISQTFANGSAAAPSVNFTQATTSGLYSPGINQVGIATSGVQAMLFDASQNVGIGGTPSTKLDVYGTANFRGATTVTTGGFTVSAGGLTVAGTSTLNGAVNITGVTTHTGNTIVAGGTFVTRGFADNATTAQWNIDAIGRLLNNGNLQPTFNANGFAAGTQTSGSTITFPTIVTNYGTGFASSTFTAPVAGVYTLSTFVKITNSGSGTAATSVTIMGSTAGVIAASQQTANVGDCVLSCTASAVQLVAGEAVQVAATALSSTLFATATRGFNGRLLG